MRFLLDTHAFLWFVLNDPQRSSLAQSLINDPANDILLAGQRNSPRSRLEASPWNPLISCVI